LDLQGVKVFPEFLSLDEVDTVLEAVGFTFPSKSRKDGGLAHTTRSFFQPLKSVHDCARFSGKPFQPVRWVDVKIRQKKYPSGVVKWQAILGVVNGRRLQKYFSSREYAENFARAFKSSLREDGIAGYALSPHDRVLSTTCLDRLVLLCVKKLAKLNPVI
jgi:hypothetical protein